jgi:hypothetical protein
MISAVFASSRTQTGRRLELLDDPDPFTRSSDLWSLGDGEG